MGEVYRARDSRLGRDVAIKVLPPGMALDGERLRRFEFEARAASALNHPNIVVVHDVGTRQGSPYLVSELLEGETLRACLARGRLPARKALEIGSQVASGLAAAHEKGIVHRDLKPENLFLTRDGHVKILDFGLAKQSPAASDGGETGTTAQTDAGTEPGKVMGTVSYMSPEQVRGEAVDHRSDIFSMGCVLYEMASGRRAFKRDTPPEVMTAILREEPPDLATLSAELPPGFGRAITHCLEKRPEERYQTARDLGFALKAAIEDSGASRSARVLALRSPGRRRWVRASGAALVVVALSLAAWWGLRGRAARRGSSLEPKRVVVAVFENQTGDTSLDPIGRMAADWVSQGLSQIAGIEVVPTTDAIDAEQAIARAETQGSRRDPLRALATTTRAGVLVSGSYYLQGAALQVQAKVLNASDWTLIHAVDPISGERAAPMTVLDAMRRRVSGVVASHFGTPLLGQGMKPPLFEAYLEFAAGQELFGTDNTQAIRHFEKAAEIDPDFLAPQLLIAVTRQNQGDFAGTEPILRRLSESREWTTPRQRSFLDWLRARQAGRWAEALQAYRPLYEQDRSAVNDVTFAFTALAANRPQLAVDALKGYASEEGDAPTSPVFRPWTLGNLAEAYHILGNYVRELEVGERTIRLHSERLLGRHGTVRALVALERLEEAQRVIDETLALQFPDGTADSLLREASLELRAHGNRAAALQVAKSEVDWVRGRPAAEQASEGYGRRLAGALYRGERWDETRAVLQGLSLPRPLPPGRGVGTTDDMPEGLPASDVAGALRTLGALAARRGDREEAERAASELAQLDGRFMRGAYTYWRAQIAALLGDKERAVALLREAFAQGYQFGAHIHRDMDLESLRGYRPYEELVKPKG